MDSVAFVYRPFGRPLFIIILTMILKLRTKNVYGNDMVYPACDNADKFASLIGKKTFSKNELAIIASLGYTLQYTI